MTEPTLVHRIEKADVARLASIHRRAFAGFFLSHLGEPFLRQFYSAFIDEPTAVIVVAHGPDGPLGAAVGTTRPASFYKRLLRRRWWGFAAAGARAAVIRPQVFPRLARAVAYRGDAPEGLDAALFASMCIEPTYKGSGLGRRLSTAWSDRAQQMGATQAYLTTDADDNDAVNRHHQRNGWVIESEYSTPEGRLMYRYIKDLGTDPHTTEGPR